ncbi:MAG: 4'-phosphopantetheinyl transferase superfamily protein [Candidatus Riflebacteria bacterium]|nr:4'-phosphopantetheinyl transferase superfamily protein [Candidatus Riflebacteria bacterium]
MLRADLFSNQPLDCNPYNVFVLREGEVHIWRILLNDELLANAGSLVSLLSPNDFEDIARVNFEIDQNRLIVRRAFVRVLLSRYLKINLQNLTFTRNCWGKPFVSPSENQCLEFNCSRADDAVLLGVSRLCTLGVDIERIGVDIQFEELAPVALSEAEREFWGNQTGLEGKRQFLRLWCRKEACLKAIGIGLLDDLTMLTVTPAVIDFRGFPDERARTAGCNEVFLQDINLGHMHVSALATTAPVAPVCESPVLKDLAIAG